MLKNALFALCQYPIPHQALSRLAGQLADSKTPWLKNLLIRQFIRTYNVDMNEAALPTAEHYETFNAFFTRALKSDARPMEDGIVSPADGVLSQYGLIHQSHLIQAKGQTYTLTSLLGGDMDQSAPYENGRFATVYLSPSDYHRVHMPCDAALRSTCYLPGRLFSVNDATTQHVPELFARNERLVCHFDTEHGPMALVLVGAMIVAGIETVWQGRYTPTHPGRAVRDTFTEEQVVLKKGDELGRFYLGSTVVMCFGENVYFSSQRTPDSTIRLGMTLAHSGNE